VPAGLDVVMVDELREDDPDNPEGFVDTVLRRATRCRFRPWRTVRWP
jgi:hypothetical protein